MVYFPAVIKLKVGLVIVEVETTPPVLLKTVHALVNADEGAGVELLVNLTLSGVGAHPVNLLAVKLATTCAEAKVVASKRELSAKSPFKFIMGRDKGFRYDLLTLY